MKLLESKSYSVLKSSFKLSFDLAFLFINGFVIRIGLVFFLYFAGKFFKKYLRKLKLKLGMELSEQDEFIENEQTVREELQKIQEFHNSPENIINGQVGHT